MLRLTSVLVLIATTTIFVACSGDNMTQPQEMAETTLGFADKAQGMNVNPGIVPPNARPHGKTYAQWSALWWQWLWSAPAETNPGLDTTGDFVSWGQSGKVWFLAPNYGGGQVDHRTATIPRGTMLFIDVAGFFCSSVTCEGQTVEELRAETAPATDQIVEMVLEVDGVAYDITDQYRIESEPFEVILPEGNMFQYWGIPIEAGTYYPGIADAYHVMLAPLSSGEHTLHIFADLGLWGTSEVFFDLTVE
jgi:hypothetical protein